jgi:DNA-binding transcriptional LysR family regulator
LQKYFAKLPGVTEPSLSLRSLTWPGVELRHLLALCAVAEERSFVRAAARLGYTQSAVSQQVAALERALGKRLLERTQGRSPIELTAAGRVVVRCAEAVARELSLTKAALDRADVTSRVLRVGIDASTGLALLPDVLAQLEHGIRLTESADEQHLLDLVAHGQLDVAFVSTPANGELASYELLAEEYVAVVGNAEVVLHGPLTPRTIASQPLLLLRNPQLRLQLERHFESFGVQLDVALEAGSPDALCELALRGHGIALLPRSLARPRGDDGVRFLEGPPVRRLVLAWRKDATRPTEPLARFVAAAQRAAAAHAAIYQNV